MRYCCFLFLFLFPGLLPVFAEKSEVAISLAAGGMYQTGNTNNTGINGSFDFSLTDSLRELSLNGRYIYGKHTNMVNQREYAAGIQYDYRPYATFSPFLRAEAYGNEFQRINFRFAGLAGLKFRFFKYKDICDYSVSAAGMYNFDNYTNESEEPNRKRIRLSFRLKLRQRIMKNVYFVQEVYYKPNVADFQDYQVSALSELKFTINELLLLRFAYLYQYDNKPVNSLVKKADARTLVSLEFNF